MEIEELVERLKAGENQKTEFKRAVTKDAARDAVGMLNTNGGEIIFGVEDDGKVVGVEEGAEQEILEKVVQPIVPKPKFGIHRLEMGGRRVVVLSLVKDGKVYAYRNVVYVRIGSMTRPLNVEEIVQHAAEHALLHFDSLECREARLEDLDPGLIEWYFEVREKVRGVRPLSPTPESMKLIRAVKEVNGELRPTNAGVLFFCRDPQRFLPHARVRLEFFEDELMLESRKKYELGGPLWKLAEETLKRLEEEVPGEFITLPTRRVERKKFPLAALREAVINALIHRNYYIPAETLVLVFPDKIEVRNPGSFPPGATPERPVHIPRNPVLAQYMYDLGHIEKYGIGIIRMREFCRANGYPEPQFILEGSFTRVVFTTLPPRVSALRQQLDGTDLDILGYLGRGKLTSSRLAALLGVSKMTVLRRLRRLEELGLVKKSGRGKGTVYFA